MKTFPVSPPLGAHESVAGGLHLAFQRLALVGGEALQLFTRNQRQWSVSPLDDEEVARFVAAWEEHPLLPVFSHASYLINLASADPSIVEKSVHGLTLELNRCRALGIGAVVLHPGAHGGQGVELGLRRVVEGLDRILDKSDGRVQILLETTAGQGTGLGSRFEELAHILDRAETSELLGVCVDTSHIFAAGYDLRSSESYTATISAMANTFGLGRIRLFHLNDSKSGLGSRIDRHDHIGRGQIGLEGFRHLLADQRFGGCPMLLETPKDETLNDDRENLRTLRALLPAPGNSDLH